MFYPLDSAEKSSSRTISGAVLLNSDIMSAIVVRTQGKVLAFKETHSAKDLVLTKKKKKKRKKVEQDACNSCQTSL